MDSGIFDRIKIKLKPEEVESLIAFIKMHEKNEIPEDVWDICLKLQEELEIW